MKALITTLSVSALLIACGGNGNKDAGDNNAPGLGAAVASSPDTNTLEVNEHFAFATARSVDIDFDISIARNTEADVAICTDFEPIGEEFDVNFDSCTVSGKLTHGVFNHSMEVTNDKESVVAVVLFQDFEMPPMYKEFQVDNNQRTRADGTSRSMIVWNQ